MLTLLIVSQEYPPETAHGGIGTQSHLKAHGMARLGHRVIVLSRAIGDVQTETTTDDVLVIRIPGMEQVFDINTVLTDQMTYSVKVAQAISQIHARYPLDLIDFPEYGNEGFVYLNNQDDWQKIATVVQLHGPLVMFGNALGWPELDSEFYRVGTAMEAACLRTASRVYSSSHCSAKWVSEHYGLNESAIPVMHTGVDTSLFYPHLSRSPGSNGSSANGFCNAAAPVILFAGNIAESKGVDILIRAAIEVADEFPGLSVRMFGKTKNMLAVELQQEAVAKGFDNLFDYRGFVSREQLAREMREADIFALPSDYEGGPGFVYLEAMASGLPCIGTEKSGATEAFIPGKTGLLVPPRNVPKLADALRALLGDGPLRKSMSHAARDFVLSNAETNICMQKIEAFYESVVRDQKQKRVEHQSQ